MRCYRTPGGRWFGTQADARAACLDEACPSDAWVEVDVPTDKPGLLDWLHLNCGPATVEAFRAERELDKLREREAAAIERITPSAPPPIQPPSRPAASAALDLTAAEEFIQAADHRQLASIMENAILRMRELGREAGL